MYIIEMRILIICLVLFCSCKRMVESYTGATAYVINNSSHTIEIRPYYKGIIYRPTIIKLQPLDSLKVASSITLGKGTIRSGFDSEYFAGSDSLIVIFDGVHSITHYVNPPLSYALKNYLYSSTRNLGNLESWEARTIKESVTHISNEYKYRFTDQDFLDTQWYEG